MSRRGLTLIELLLSIALLAAIVSVAAAWTTLAGRFAATGVEPVKARNGAQALLQVIHDDLVAGDFAGLQAETDAAPRATWSDGVLRIQTRDIAGATSRSFRFDQGSETICLHQTGPSRPEAEVLANGVGTFDCRIDEARTFLTVEISLRDGQVLRRRYRLP